MLYREIIAVCSEIHKEDTKTLCGQNVEFVSVKLGGSGPGSVVGKASGYGLDDPGIEFRWGTRFSAPVQTGPGAHPASWTMVTAYFPGVKSGWGVTLTPHRLLVSWSRKSRAIPLLLLWAVRSVQSLSACTKVHFTFKLGGSKLN